MNLIWAAMTATAFVFAAINGRMPETVNAIFEGSATAAATAISLAGTLCFWSGIMKIAETSGICSALCRAIAPFINWLFPQSGKKAREYISVNMSANLLGMGNAATPPGMLAAEELDRENPTPEKPSRAMCMLIALNTTAFQLMPTTVIALRAAAGSADPVSIIVPTWIASAAASAAAISAAKLHH